MRMFKPRCHIVAVGFCCQVVCHLSIKLLLTYPTVWLCIQVTMCCFLLLLAGFVITQVATSTGSDGHSLALTESGEVFSWGDGDYGKLGHGNCYRQKRPKQIEALQGEEVIQVRKKVSQAGKRSYAGDAQGTVMMFQID